MLYTANALANLLDPEQDGTIDFECGGQNLQENLLGFWIKGGDSMRSEWAANHIMEYSYGLENWMIEDGDQEKLKAQCFEKAFLLTYQHGYAPMWPQTFGYRDDKDYISSITCREVARLQCV